MSRANLTPENLRFTRKDFANLLNNVGKANRAGVRKALQAKGLNEEEINKLLTDVNSY